MRTNGLFAVILVQAALGSWPVQAQPQLDGVDPAFIEGYLTRALAGTAADEFMVGAMMARHHAHPLFSDFLDQTFPADGEDPSFAALIVAHCRANPVLPRCAAGAAQDSFIVADSDNIHPYLLKMLWWLQQDQRAEALLALTTGLAVPDTDDLYWRNLALVRAQLLASGYPADKRNLAAEGYPDPLSLYAVYNELLLACRENGAVEPAWAQACLQLGSRLESAGSSMFATVFGASIQRDMLQIIDPDGEELQAVLVRRQYYDDVRTEAAALDWWGDVSLSSKPDQFYADAIAFGELRAIELALERAGTP